MGSGAGPNMMTPGRERRARWTWRPTRHSVTGRRAQPDVRRDAEADARCFSENRATLHLHGGITPWISDGTPHQWVTPAGENTAYPKGVSVSNVPDMPDPGPGAETFFYTNQQSARLMFYHDHSWGITRLNVYAGEAAGYLLTDPTEQSLIAAGGALAGLGIGTPLSSRTRRSCPSAAKMAQLDPTWDDAKWGGEGNLWTPHVYMPAQNPGDPSGMSAFGRWMYGPWFWPPAKDAKYPPIANPYYDPDLRPERGRPFCEPAQIPSTPNISVGMEAFNDTPLVNGTAYPTTTVDPKAYRYRILNAANDRFWNLSVVRRRPDHRHAQRGRPEAAEVAAAQTDPIVFPTPDTTKSPKGPSWIQIGTEGGFLPAPAVVPAQRPPGSPTRPGSTSATSTSTRCCWRRPSGPTSIVDFSQYRGQDPDPVQRRARRLPGPRPRLRLLHRRPGPDPGRRADHPARLRPEHPDDHAGQGVQQPHRRPPSTGRTPRPTDGHADGGVRPPPRRRRQASGVFESGSGPDHRRPGRLQLGLRHDASPPAAGATARPTRPPSATASRGSSEQGGDTVQVRHPRPAPQLQVPFQPKALHDEMNSANFDEWGRMTANLGLEAPGATPLLQNIILYPYVNPATEILDATGLPSSLDVTPISSAADGTQIWKITHNGVDTHPIHFHLYDVQVINRVTWDNIIIPPDPTELGWKDTVRVSPLEDTIVALRPIVPDAPVRDPGQHPPAQPDDADRRQGSRNRPNGTEAGFNNTDTNGNPIDPIVNTIDELRLGVRLPLPHPQPRGDGHDAADHRRACLGRCPTRRCSPSPAAASSSTGPTAHPCRLSTRPLGQPEE